MLQQALKMHCSARTAQSRCEKTMRRPMAASSSFRIPPGILSSSCCRQVAFAERSAILPLHPCRVRVKFSFRSRDLRSVPATPRLKVLIPQTEIHRRVRAMARRISRDFRGQPVHLIGVLNGACIFLADLARQLDLEVSIDFMAVSSYGGERNHSGQTRLVKDSDAKIEGLNVLVVEDILDTGLTLDYLLRVLAPRRPKCLRIVTLLDKPSRRVASDVRPDYVGFEIPNQFVVGYGLDWAGRFRHLRDICVLAPEADAVPRRRSARTR